MATSIARKQSPNAPSQNRRQDRRLLSCWGFPKGNELGNGVFRQTLVNRQAQVSPFGEALVLPARAYDCDLQGCASHNI